MSKNISRRDFLKGMGAASLGLAVAPVSVLAEGATYKAGTYTATRYGNIWSALQNNGSRLLIITQNRSSAYWNNASCVLNCGSTNQNDVGKYSALLAADLLVMHYLRQYGRDFF